MIQLAFDVSENYCGEMFPGWVEKKCRMCFAY